MKHILCVLFLLSLSTSSFAGYAGFLAPAHKFRILLEGRSVQREVTGHIIGYPAKDTVSVSYPLLRFEYGLSGRLRLSGDFFLFREVEDNPQGQPRLGNRVFKNYSLVGFSLQSEIWRWGKYMPLDATAGYWEAHTFQTDYDFPNTVRTERSLSLTLARELTRISSDRLYAGVIFAHLRKDGLEYDLANTSGLASHREVGIVAGVDARFDRHIVLNGEAFWTGDYTLSGGLGWEF